MNAESTEQNNSQLVKQGELNKQFLSFIMDGEEYGVDILTVQEIRGWEEITAIPNAPNFIKGAINLRGTIVPIIDLRLRFGLSPTTYGALTVVIVVKVEIEQNEKIMGLIVDAVSDVYEVDELMIQPQPEFGVEVNSMFIRGLIDTKNTMLTLLKVEQILNINVSAEKESS